MVLSDSPKEPEAAVVEAVTNLEVLKYSENFLSRRGIITFTIRIRLHGNTWSDNKVRELIAVNVLHT